MLILRSLRDIRILALLLGSGLSVAAQADELLLNGGFEQGLSGWRSVSVTDPGGAYDASYPIGGYVIGGASGVAAYSGLQALPPASGGGFALADSTAVGSMGLLQDFTVPFGAVSVGLSYTMYVYDWAGFGPQGTSLDLGAGSQIARVDLLRAGAADFSTEGTDLVATFYASAESDPNVAFQNATFDLTPLVQAGQTYRLRFAVADSLFVLSQGIDDVSVSAQVVPEPASLVALTLGGALLRRRARRA